MGRIESMVARTPEPRAAALARARGEYAFWLDADDVIDPPQRKKLEALRNSLGEPVFREGEPPREPH